ncbi:septum formation family protein [Georgenia sp. Z1344]|uniref:septum formation family protein n=1 Tax=Georgenia sp. Z1344 TaxID=3416706 RepID=UPI003CEEC085
MRATHARRAAAVAAAALAVPFLAACGSTVQQFEAGQCLDMSDATGGQVSEIPEVDCEDEHTGEVYLVHTFDGDEFPGQTEVGTELETACADAFEGYVGTDYASSQYMVQLLTPTQETWDEADDRDGICILSTSSPTTGSAEGSAS